MHVSKLIKDLRRLNEGITSKEAKEHKINTSKLLSLGLIKKKSHKRQSYNIPEGAPRWAAKFRHTRKKYNVSVTEKTESIWVLTERGHRRLKSYTRKPDAPKPDEKQEIKKEPETPEED